MPPISKSSVGTPFFISFLGFTYIELQVYKLLPKSGCRFYLGRMTSRGLLDCILFAPFCKYRVFHKQENGLDLHTDGVQALHVLIIIYLQCMFCLRTEILRTVSLM